MCVFKKEFSRKTEISFLHFIELKTILTIIGPLIELASFGNHKIFSVLMKRNRFFMIISSQMVGLATSLFK
jgi:hypothetical protein